MIPHRLLAATCVAMFGITPVAAPGSPTPTPAFQPCPMVPAAQAVKTPAPNSPAPPRDPAQPVIGGAGLGTAGLTLPQGVPALPALGARAWLVADLDSGAVLGACGPHERLAPASVLKLLLAATALPKLDPTQTVEVTAADLNIERGSSAVGLVTGGHYTIETLWLGLLLVSGNDAANTLARLAGGADGVPGTLAAMNKLAHDIGARDTTALTPHGLDAAGQYTSPYDLALIARACVAREDFRKYATTPNAQVPPQPPRDPRGFQIQNENQLVMKYQGALGGKTGFTNAARHSYVGVAERGGRRLVVTLLDAEAVPQRGWQQGASLLDWGFSVPAGLSVGHLVQQGELDRPAANASKATTGTKDTKPAKAGDTPEAALVGLVVVAVLGVAAGAVFLLRRRAVRRTAARRAARRAAGGPPGRAPDDRRLRARRDAARPDPASQDPASQDPASQDAGRPRGGRPRDARPRGGRSPDRQPPATGSRSRRTATTRTRVRHAATAGTGRADLATTRTRPADAATTRTRPAGSATNRSVTSGAPNGGVRRHGRGTGSRATGGPWTRRRTPARRGVRVSALVMARLIIRRPPVTRGGRRPNRSGPRRRTAVRTGRRRDHRVAGWTADRQASTAGVVRGRLERDGRVNPCAIAHAPRHEEFHHVPARGSRLRRRHRRHRPRRPGRPGRR